jgi:Zn-dependent membrane protease YugP
MHELLVELKIASSQANTDLIIMSKILDQNKSISAPLDSRYEQNALSDHLDPASSCSRLSQCTKDADFLLIL